MTVMPHQRRASDVALARCEGARLELARLHVDDDPSLRSVWRKLAKLVTDAMQVERVGIWLLLDDGRAIRCEHLYQSSVRQVFEGAVLRAQDFPAYFEAMDERRVIIADDARTSPVTGSLRDSYLDPLGIASMLDAPIYREGKVVGVVCHEHIGAARIWTEVESAFAAAVADTTARLYEEAARQHAESSLRGYEHHMLELHRMEAIGRMAAGIAHDFRGVLGSVLGFAQLILRTPNLPANVQGYANRIVESAERGTRLTREVTDFVHDHPVSPCVLDVPRTIENMRSMLNSLLGDDTQLTIRARGAVSRVFMDPTQLERMVLNLVLNARDAMPAGGSIEIDVRDTQISEDEPTMVTICVSDTGVGMDEATREQACKPLFSTKGANGTGLGLSIVEQIVSRAGGSMRIDSEIGKGTQVHLFVPRIAMAAEAAA
jgi:two-component system cell cycle sensor histidine kinase/response regulator CckA